MSRLMGKGEFFCGAPLKFFFLLPCGFLNQRCPVISIVRCLPAKAPFIRVMYGGITKPAPAFHQTAYPYMSAFFKNEGLCSGLKPDSNCIRGIRIRQVA